MLSLIPIFTAIFNLCIGLRILTFTSTHHRKKPFFSYIAVLFVGLSLGNAVTILVNGRFVTIPETVLTLIFALLVLSAKGNMAEVFRGLSKKIFMGDVYEH